MDNSEFEFRSTEYESDEKVMEYKLSKLKKLHYQYTQVYKEFLDMRFVDDDATIRLPEEAVPVIEELDELLEMMDKVAEEVQSLQARIKSHKRREFMIVDRSNRLN